MKILGRAARRAPLFLAGIAFLSVVNVASAGSITFSGKITQSVADGTGPPGNNLSLNGIQDGQDYFVTAIFPGVLAAGFFNLTSLSFDVPSAGASETSFGAMTMSITLNGGFDEFSLLGCLTTGSGCAQGNQLDANFKIPVASLNSSGVGAIGLDLPHSLDLLEDDGTTDIQGTITAYSSVPEPSSWVLLGGAVVAVIRFGRAKKNQKENNKEEEKQK